MAAGALLGTGLSLLLLRFKVIPQSFADYDECEQAFLDKLKKQEDNDEKDTWFHYPHARREVLKECLFLLPPAVGAYIGFLFMPANNSALWPAWLFVLGGVCLGTSSVPVWSG